MHSFQGVTKRCRLSWRPRIWAQMRGEREVAGSQPMNENSCGHHVTWSPNKLWRSNSIFSLWLCLLAEQFSLHNLPITTGIRRNTAATTGGKKWQLGPIQMHRISFGKSSFMLAILPYRIFELNCVLSWSLGKQCRRQKSFCRKVCYYAAANHYINLIKGTVGVRSWP